MRRLLRRCLDKDRTRRLQSAADARIEIEDARAEPEPSARAVASSAARTRERLTWISALALVTLIAAVAVLWVRRPAASASSDLEARLQILTPATTEPVSLAISPDGRRIVFVASGDGASRLWLRPLDAVTAQPLTGTERAVYPFWAPNSRSIGFFADGNLKRIDVAGPPRPSLPYRHLAVGRGAPRA